ncbi:hypothetical protein KVQ32_10120 [Klebsiella pneumoniae]|nr:hypothetical protein [Klebsiella pneumoniae]HBV1819065.1 hypothetical protein [Klebsiella pneumoniae]HBV1824870.1 hypothetical protein [Klebsiella pneumoniae]HBX2619680.1 hypothetical protein [Klebsiella pneumoniae]HBZ2317044.1 hypothetical protein [Klebsiella pneumoniae]
MHQQTTQTKRFNKILNWCQGQVREIEFILEDAYLSEEEKISSLEELLDKCLTMQAPLIVLSNKIKTTIKQLNNQRINNA